jgi:DNA-directed RNA polymerase specialized sigma24 family protein
MDNIKQLMSNMLTEREIMIFMLIESGMSYRDLADRILVSHENVRNTYDRAKAKMSKFGDAGFFSTDIKQ